MLALMGLPWGALVAWLFVEAVWRDAARRARQGQGRLALRLLRPVATAAALVAPGLIEPFAAVFALVAFVVVRTLLVLRKGAARGG